MSPRSRATCSGRSAGLLQPGLQSAVVGPGRAQGVRDARRACPIAETRPAAPWRALRGVQAARPGALPGLDWEAPRAPPGPGSAAPNRRERRKAAVGARSSLCFRGVTGSHRRPGRGSEWPLSSTWRPGRGATSSPAWRASHGLRSGQAQPAGQLPRACRQWEALAAGGPPQAGSRLQPPTMGGRVRFSGGPPHRLECLAPLSRGATSRN